MVTIYDIAKRCKCAPATVSKALNNYYGVSTKTMKLIKNTAKEMGYLPNTMARSLTTKRSYIIGVLIYINDFAGLNHNLFMSILNYFKICMENSGCDILLLSKNIKSNQMSFLNHCRTRQVEGVLAFGDFTSEPLRELLNSDLPIIGYDYMGDKIGGVTTDNFESMKALAEYLTGLGHEKIAYIKGEDNYVTKERLKGFLEVANAKNITDKIRIIESCYYSQSRIYAETQKLLEQADRPTAIIYPDDYSSLGGIKAIREKGLDYPKDISIAAYDGLEIMNYCFPPLTTVAQDFKKIGEVLADRLLTAIQHPDDTETNKKIDRIDSKLIIGGSCAAPLKK